MMASSLARPGQEGGNVAPERLGLIASPERECCSGWGPATPAVGADRQSLASACRGVLGLTKEGLWQLLREGRMLALLAWGMGGGR